MIARQPDGTGIEIVERLEEIGFDYIELSLAHMMALSDSDFDVLKERLQGSGLRCEACNNFFPSHIRLTGIETDMKQTLNYVDRAFQRASRLGVEVIVFGSSGAKNVPDGFSKDLAWAQIVHLLRAIDPLAERYGITVAIEPLNRLESNIVNTAAEGLRLAREVDRGNIQLLVDYYHLVMEKESLDVIREAADFIRHLHFAEPRGRIFPLEIQAGYADFFARLKEIDYTGRLSLEAYSKEFAADARRSLSLLRQLEKEVWDG
jgi:sugar phosphate isomerase/epimerase